MEAALSVLGDPRRRSPKKRVREPLPIFRFHRATQAQDLQPVYMNRAALSQEIDHDVWLEQPFMAATRIPLLL